MNSSDRGEARTPAAVVITSNFFRKLLMRRGLIRNFAARDLKSRYVGSFMGFFWSVVHPLVLLVCYTFVFSIVFEIRPYTTATDNFAVFLFCGILPWLYFQDTVLRCCGCVVDHAGLIRKTLFPSEILAVALVFSNLVYHLVGLGLLTGVLLWMGLLSWTALLLPLYLLPLMILCLGLGWLLGSLHVFLRDTLQVLSVLLVFLFWFTPIFYMAEQVPESFRPVLAVNPLSAVVAGYRGCLLEGTAPALGGLAYLWTVSVLLFALGGLVFRNTKREFADVL
jgi:lipopolysaccharide transport system permease protein